MNSIDSSAAACLVKIQEYVTAEDAVSLVQSGNRVFLHGSAATPVFLIQALQQRHAELHNVELASITSLGEVHFDDPACRGSFFVNSLFVSANTRNVVSQQNKKIRGHC